MIAPNGSTLGEVNWALSSIKVLIEFGVNLLNQILAVPLNVVGKALHMISSGLLGGASES